MYFFFLDKEIMICYLRIMSFNISFNVITVLYVFHRVITFCKADNFEVKTISYAKSYQLTQTFAHTDLIKIFVNLDSNTILYMFDDLYMVL